MRKGEWEENEESRNRDADFVNHNQLIIMIKLRSGEMD